MLFLEITDELINLFLSFEIFKIFLPFQIFKVFLEITGQINSFRWDLLFHTIDDVMGRVFQVG